MLSLLQVGFLVALFGTIVAVNVTIYYEATGNESVNFIRKHLQPTWEELEKELKIDLVPYGRATHKKLENGTWTFTCMLGPEQCQKNKLHACALHYLAHNDSVKMQFVFCEVYYQQDDRTQKCAHLGEEFQQILSCADGPEGDQLLADLGDRTHNLSPKLSRIPAVYFDNEYCEKDQKDALTELQSLLYKRISGKRNCDGAESRAVSTSGEENEENGVALAKQGHLGLLFILAVNVMLNR